MLHEVVDGTDFGVPVDALRPGKEDLLTIPVEFIESRKVRPATVTTSAPDAKVEVVAPVPGTAMKAAAAEVTAPGDGVTFEYDGQAYTVPRPENWDVAVFEAEEDGKLVSTVRALLGPEQWKTFRQASRTLKDLNDLWGAATTAGGISPGNSDGSATS